MQFLNELLNLFDNNDRYLEAKHRAEIKRQNSRRPVLGLAEGEKPHLLDAMRMIHNICKLVFQNVNQLQ